MHFGKTITHTPMDAIPKGHVRARIGPVNDHLVGLGIHGFIPITGEVPHDDLVTLSNRFAAELNVSHRSTAHVNHRGLPAHHLGDHIGN